MLDFEICQRNRQDILKAGQQFRVIILYAVKNGNCKNFKENFNMFLKNCSSTFHMEILTLSDCSKCIFLVDVDNNTNAK